MEGKFLTNTPKIALIGLSRAGKTSIYKRCFEHKSIEELKNILPTIMISQNQVNLEHISKGISIWDFGGQESFRKAYLQNPDYFDYTKVIIFVIDMLVPEDLKPAINYFLEILGVLDNKNKPNIYVFIHKCDPDKIYENSEQISKIIFDITNVFGETVEFFLTSVFDNSACKAINRILFLSLPEEVIDQIFTNLFLKDMKQAVFQKLGSENLSLEQISEISEISEVFGDLLTEKLYKLWINSTLTKSDSKNSPKNSSLIQTLIKDGKLFYKLKCPIENCTEKDCQITKGIIRGILNSLDFKDRKVELIKENDDCLIIF
ncbi:MAG: hypothetical protein EAX96_13225 [Candidatus Lokiarchaeota archaeon]|nr:hypothetical protein [Candidatus Lokiarchaeota archaeon]